MPDVRDEPCAELRFGRADHEPHRHPVGGFGGAPEDVLWARCPGKRPSQTELAADWTESLLAGAQAQALAVAQALFGVSAGEVGELLEARLRERYGGGPDGG